MKRTQIYFSEVQKKILQKMAKQKGLPFAELVRRAVDAFIQKEEKNNGK